MLRPFILLAIIAAFFLALPPVPAAAWSSVPFLLLAALLFDAYRRGRRLLLARKAADPGDDADPSRLLAGMMLFSAVWAGLSGPSAAADTAHMHGLDAGFDPGRIDAGGGDGGAGF